MANKKRHLSVAVTEAQFKRWKRAAGKDGRKVSSWVRRGLDALADVALAPGSAQRGGAR